jgi:cell division transport system permease protein
MVQVVLGYEPPPAPAPVNLAWRPPAEVAARIARGRGNGAGGRAVAPVPVVGGAEAGSDGGAWRPPACVAGANEVGVVAAPVSGGSNGHGDGNGRRPRRFRVGRVAQVVLGYVPPPPPAGLSPRRRLRAGVGRVAQVVLGYVPPPAPPARSPRNGSARPPRRWPWTPVMNLGRLAVGGAVASWARNLGTAAPALGSITLLLLLGGILSVSGFAVNSVLGLQESEASVLHVYMGDDATSDQVDQARQGLAVLPQVRSVRYIDKDQALAQARQRPGLSELASLSDTNPFPASLEVHVHQPGDVASVAKVAAAEPGVDGHRPTSYDPGTYQRLRQFTAIAIVASGGFGLLLLLVTYGISSNSIRAAVLARRDELVTMQLVGASRWLVRTRLGVEGALTGGLAGLIAAGLVVGVCVAAFYGARHVYVQVLPGVTALRAGEVVAGVAAVGVCLGTISALFAFRRLRT